MRFALRCGVFAMILLAAACRREEPPRDQLLGAWTGTGGRMEFFRGGRVFVSLNSGVRGAGRYEFVERDRIVVVWEGNVAHRPAGDYRLRFEQDVLVLCPADRPISVTTCVAFERVGPRGS
jgi:hypothetical protein